MFEVTRYDSNGSATGVGQCLRDLTATGAIHI